MTTRLLLLTLFLVFSMHGMHQPRTIIKIKFRDSSLGKDLPLTASLQPITNEQEIQQLGYLIATLTTNVLYDVHQKEEFRKRSQGGTLNLYVEQKNDHLFNVGLHCKNAQPTEMIKQSLEKEHELSADWIMLPHQVNTADNPQEQQECALNMDTIVKYTFDNRTKKWLKRKICSLIKNSLTDQEKKILIERTYNAPMSILERTQGDC